MGTCLADAHLEGKRILRMFLTYPCALSARYKTEPSPERREMCPPFRKNNEKGE